MTDDKPDLAAVLDYYGVDYYPTKHSQKCLCPVHEDHIKSCSINLDEQWFVCHACEAKGDSWNLIMAKEGCDFAAAKRFAEKLAFTGGSGIRGSGEPRTDGLFGRQRAVSRDRARSAFRPSLRAVERS